MFSCVAVLQIQHEQMVYSRHIARFLDAVPGKKLSVYRFMPIYFVFGALLEFTMINWRVGNVNFCMFITALYSHIKKLQRLSIEVVSIP